MMLGGGTHTEKKVHTANMGPIWGRQDPGGPHVGYMNVAIWAANALQSQSMVMLYTYYDIVRLICETEWHRFPWQVILSRVTMYPPPQPLAQFHRDYLYLFLQYSLKFDFYNVLSVVPFPCKNSTSNPAPKNYIPMH